MPFPLLQNQNCAKIKKPSFSASFLHPHWFCPVTALFALPSFSNRQLTGIISDTEQKHTDAGQCTAIYNTQVQACTQWLVPVLGLHSKCFMIGAAPFRGSTDNNSHMRVQPNSRNQYNLSFTEPVQSALLWHLNSQSDQSFVTDFTAF